MELALEILLEIVALICFLGGANVLIKGAMYFLPKGTPTQHILDDLVGFLGAIYFSTGCLFTYAALNVSTIGPCLIFSESLLHFQDLADCIRELKLVPRVDTLTSLRL